MRMTKEQIPEFVHAILDTGCDMQAISHDLYCIADADVPDDIIDEVSKEVHRISESYGERDHLRAEIASYLRSIGHFIEIEISTPPLNS